jgi:phosphohistidine phosphatase SixA
MAQQKGAKRAVKVAKRKAKKAVKIPKVVASEMGRACM